MSKGFMFASTVVVLSVVFATIALPEITSNLLTTQSTATGITGPLDLAITNLSYILPLGVLALIGAVLIIGRGR